MIYIYNILQNIALQYVILWYSFHKRALHGCAGVPSKAVVPPSATSSGQTSSDGLVTYWRWPPSIASLHVLGQVNFYSFGNAFMLLVRCATGERPRSRMEKDSRRRTRHGDRFRPMTDLKYLVELLHPVSVWMKKLKKRCARIFSKTN